MGESLEQDKVAGRADQALIESVADQVYEGTGDPNVEEIVPDTGTMDAGRAVYPGEDRDMKQPASENHLTTGSTHTGAGEDIPESAHYRKADGEAHSCGTCEYFKQGHCSMYDTSVGADMTCDEWEGKDMRESHVVEANWEVLALGESQQPGGVGATMQDNTAPLGGPNPMADYHDVADNSFEQDVAFKRWVDMAVDQLNRGTDPEVVLAQLAHDGCPEPEAVMQRAVEQPVADTTGDDQGLSEPLPAPNNMGDMDNVSTLPTGVQAGTRVKVAGLEAVRIGDYEQWGEKMTRVIFANGKTADVPAANVEDIAAAVDEPVEDIQKFIDSFPPVDEQKRSSIHDRIVNIKQARQAIVSSVASTMDYQLHTALDVLDVGLANELEAREYQLENFQTDGDIQYLQEQPRYDVQVVEQESFGAGADSSYFLNDQVAELENDLESTDFDQVVNEDSAIMVSELSPSDLSDSAHVHQLAASYIDQKTAGLKERERATLRGRFVEAVMDEREKLMSDPEEPDVEPTPNEFEDGPAEALFV